MLAAPLQCHPSVCDLYAIYAAFDPIKFRLEQFHINSLSFISNYMYSLYVNVQFLLHFVLFLSVTFFSNFTTILLNSIKSYQQAYLISVP